MARTRGGARVRKSIFDPVHGPISLDGVALAVVATPEFQRLWGIRQTGFAHLVFPGANHTRLEHSLGTFWVAKEMAGRLDLDPGVSERVAVAALLHDLGHPPFSHTLDGPLKEALGFDHERLSRARIEGTDPSWSGDRAVVPAVLERAGLSPREVADLVDPPSGQGARSLPTALLHGAIDADRIDYLQRDAHYTGVAHGAIDAVRLLDTLRRAGRGLAFAEKGRSAVEGFLVGRALMYSTVYYHKTVRAAEMMAQAAVERTEAFPHGAREIFALTDGELLHQLRTSGSPSRDLVDGLLERRLYKRAHGWRSLGRSTQAAWRRLARTPPARRQLEDELAQRVAGPPGSVLVDLAGLDPRGEPAADWGDVGILADGLLTHPFKGEGPWKAMASRPPAEWAVSIYALPKYRSAVTRELSRRGSSLP